MIEKRQPLGISADSPAVIGASRSISLNAVSEVGWWDTPRILTPMSAGGSPEACQWGIRFDPDSCSLLQVEALIGGGLLLWDVLVRYNETTEKFTLL